MDRGVIIWLIIFGIAAALFFTVSVVVSIKGFGDLRTLLRYSRPSDRSNDDTEGE